MLRRFAVMNNSNHMEMMASLPLPEILQSSISTLKASISFLKSIDSLADGIPSLVNQNDKQNLLDSFDILNHHASFCKNRLNELCRNQQMMANLQSVQQQDQHQQYHSLLTHDFLQKQDYFLQGSSSCMSQVMHAVHQNGLFVKYQANVKQNSGEFLHKHETITRNTTSLLEGFNGLLELYQNLNQNLQPANFFNRPAPVPQNPTQTQNLNQNTNQPQNHNNNYNQPSQRCVGYAFM